MSLTYQTTLDKLLETYIVKAYSENNPSSGTRSFFRSTSPRLEKDRINRILVYRGCFNPPHIGHLYLIRLTFMRAKEQLNTVAVIIIPLSNTSCANKLENEDDKKSLLFSHTERTNF